MVVGNSKFILRKPKVRLELKFKAHRSSPLKWTEFLLSLLQKTLAEKTLAVETAQRQQAHKRNLPGAGCKTLDFRLFKAGGLGMQ